MMRCCRDSHLACVRRTIAMAGVGIAALLAFSCASPPSKGLSFQTPEAAVAALGDAIKADDVARAEAIFGPEGRNVLHSGDDVADRTQRHKFAELYAQKHGLEKDASDTAILTVGEIDWPFPIPLVRDADGWYFDTEAGKEEILNRRIGKNELSTIEVCLAYVEAQKEYVRKDWDGNGLYEYAQKFRSSPGKKDGLYWDAKKGEVQSPMGELAAEAAKEGYARDAKSEEPRPYFGHLYKLLKAQGSHAQGGAYDYMAHGSMIGGFALLAYPAEYENSGIMTFIVSHDGVVYQKDLGPQTADVADKITRFDPDETWQKAPSTL